MEEKDNENNGPPEPPRGIPKTLSGIPIDVKFVDADHVIVSVETIRNLIASNNSLLDKLNQEIANTARVRLTVTDTVHAPLSAILNLCQELRKMVPEDAPVLVKFDESISKLAGILDDVNAIRAPLLKEVH
jgi:hypothetical protein